MISKALTMMEKRNKQKMGPWILAIFVIIFLSSCGKSVKYRYSENGVLHEKVHMKHGVYHGEFIEYYYKGGVKMRCNYENGKLKGKLVEYDTAGIIISESFFADGVRQGKRIKYYPDGGILEEMDYDQGWMNGEQIRYHQNGKISRYALIERDEVIYSRDYDTTGRETFQDRKIIVTPDSDTLTLGKHFRVKVEFYGPYEKPAKIGARLAPKPMTQENMEMFEMEHAGPYYITFFADRTGHQYVTIRLALEPLICFVRVIPIYVR